jgi:hypothetical protein
MRETSQVPAWGLAVVEFFAMFTAMVVLKGLLSSDGFSGGTFLWAVLVAATLTVVHEWQRRRKRAKPGR